MTRTRMSHVLPCSKARLYAALALLPLARMAGGIRPAKQRREHFHWLSETT